MKDAVESVVIGVVAVALITGLVFMWWTWQERDHEKRMDKLELCRNIEDGATRTLCIQGVQ
jgi:hypothetical protein